MTQATLFVCELCRFSATEKSHAGNSGGQHLLEQLHAELQQRNLQTEIQVQPVRCVAACDQYCNATLAAPNKLTYILSNLSASEGATVLSEFCQQYAQSPDGRVPYRERSPAFKAATAFILPPLPTNSEAKSSQS